MRDDLRRAWREANIENRRSRGELTAAGAHGWVVTEVTLVTGEQLGEPESDAVRLALCDWVKRHDIDPVDVPLRNTIIRRILQRQVSLDVFARDDLGRRRLIPGTHEYVRQNRTIQLEAPPLPWPAEVLAVAHTNRSEETR